MERDGEFQVYFCVFRGVAMLVACDRAEHRKIRIVLCAPYRSLCSA